MIDSLMKGKSFKGIFGGDDFSIINSGHAERLRMLERGPRWDGSRLDRRAILDWMFSAEAHAPG